MHFSRPSGQRFSWCLPWNRGAVGSFCSGYWMVSTFLNICRKVTPNPLIGFRKSSTGDLLDRALGLDDAGRAALRARADADAVIVRQVHRRDGEGARLRGLAGVRRVLLRGGLFALRRPG